MEGKRTHRKGDCVLILKALFFVSLGVAGAFVGQTIAFYKWKFFRLLPERKLREGMGWIRCGALRH